MVRLKRSICLIVVLFGLSAPACMMAQAAKSGVDHTDSRVDVYAGYGYWHPLNSGINGYQYQDVTHYNGTLSVAAYFNKYVGVQAEGGYFQGNGEHHLYDSVPGGGCTGQNCSQLVYTAEGGPILRYPLGSFIPFIHMLGGGERYNGPVGQSLFWGWGVTGGGGLDWVLPPFHHRIALRLFQADFQYSQVVFGPLVLPNGTTGGFGEIDALKLSGGVVVRFGDARGPAPVQLGCTADPVSVFPGDPVKITGSSLNLNPKLKAVYSWSGKGLTVSGNNSTTTVDTTGLAAGEYVVNGKVAEGSKPKQQAICTAPFTVKAFEPPTISCSANPSTVASGTDVNISTSGGSPQNRPLTYSYSATAGQVTSNGPTAKLTTAGLSPSTITVTCNVVDDLGQTATSTTTVEITAPVAPVASQTQQLCSISFARDKKRPVRVDNEAKGCLDDIALTLNQQADAHLIVVGNFTPKEKEAAAAERTLNARQYLTKEKGIDPSRIEVRIGTTPGQTVDDILVPAGAVYNNIDTHPFDESSIVRHGQAYGVPHAKSTGAPHKKAASAKKPEEKPTPNVSFGPSN
jgi:hypothetical protein